MTNGHDTEARKLLAINFGGIGDEVLFLPTLKTVRQAHKNWQITLLTEPRASSIMQVTDLIDANIVFDIKKRPLLPGDYLELIALLRRGNYDVVLSSGSSPQVSMLLYLSGIKERIGYDSGKVAKMLLTNPVPLNRRQHATLMYHDLVAGLGLNGKPGRPEAVVNPGALKRMRDLLGTTAGADKYILLHPGTSKLAVQKGVIKTWSPANWVTLIERLADLPGVVTLLCGGPDDAEIVQEIGRLIENSPAREKVQKRFLNLYGKTRSLADLAALIDLSTLVICVDSAPMHIAVGLNKPLVAMFGPTDPAKLLWPSERFKAISDQRKRDEDDPFSKQSLAQSAGQRPPDVEIQPDIVFQTATDLLNSI